MGFQSSVNLGLRIMSHLIYGSSNERLQNSILKNGLGNFTLLIIEWFEFDPDLTDRENITQLLAIEQKFLDILFTLPAKFLYNFNRIAGSNVGYKHSEEARAKISESATGENNPNYGNTGANHPFYDKTHTDEARAKMSVTSHGCNT